MVVAISVLLGITSTTGFFVYQDFGQTIQAEETRLKSSAAAFAAAAASAVTAGDRRSSLEVLRGIRELQHVDYASATTADGHTLAEIGASTALVSRDRRLDSSSLLSVFMADSISVSAAVHQGGIVVGSINFHADISWLRALYLQNLLVSLAFGACIVAATAFLAWARIAHIIGPLRSLTEEFTDIGRRSDLSRRVRVVANDEIGILSGAFNDMFARIEDRDRQLQRHRETLEDTVTQRTSEMREAKNDAERANAAKSEFLATVSHEIRTPMNGMLVMAEMLSVAPLPPKHLRYAQTILRSGRGLLNILNDILDLSKVEAGRLDIEAHPVSIDTVVEDVAALFFERASQKSLSMAISIDEDVPRQVIGDAVRINQVLTNLVNNALKFTEQGGVTIKVRRANWQDGVSTANLAFDVIDTGMGIPHEKLGRLFGRFSQADETITRKFGGTGLGLAISKQLVEAMGGTIRVTSREGHGSCFGFDIALPVELGATPLRDLEGRRIQVLDGNPITEDVTVAVLSARGAIVVPGNCTEPVDLVLAHDGIDTAALVGRYSRGHPPIVLLRSGMSAQPVDPCILEIATAEMTIPLRRSELETLVEAVLTGDFGAMKMQVQDAEIATNHASFSQLSVLIVDDMAVNREVLTEALISFGVKPDQADSGERAVELSEGHAYDLIFMDCSMPGMDGYTAAERIRGIEVLMQRRGAHILALTGHHGALAPTDWRKAGMDAHLSKPFEIAQIENALRIAAGAVQATDRGAADGSVFNDADLETANELEKPVLDVKTVDMLKALALRNGPGVLERIVQLFAENAPKLLADVQRAYDDGKGDGAQSAHALKSICNSAGAERAAFICGQIEFDWSNNRAVNALTITNLAKAVEEARQQLSRLCSTSEQPAGLDQIQSPLRDTG